MAMYTTTISLDEPTMDMLARIKERTERSASQVIKDLIKLYGDDYVSKVVDFYKGEI